MNLLKEQLWKRFQRHYRDFPSVGLSVDISRMNFGDSFCAEILPRMRKAFEEMQELEKGAKVNTDEDRMVGHYWLRNAALAPTSELREAIVATVQSVHEFARRVHTGELGGARGPFKNLLLIGIGGSALGPQFVSNALGHPGSDKMRVFFFDNTDPDGMDKVLAAIGDSLDATLCLVISKSGGTKETRNGMLEAESAFRRAGLDFGAHAIAITREDSELDHYASNHAWLQRFPMWDWVGGRTSETSVVGLLPAALQGIEINELLRGAAACDELTRRPDLERNPAALLSAMWHYIGNGYGRKAMVVLPYKDRLELFSKYLQQLVMESIGKEKNRDGNVINAGLTVYGNKGSTDQHAYVQQLRDGINNFFVTFIEVLKDREGESTEVDPMTTSGDYLNGFLFGTRTALYDSGRESITITIKDVSPFSVGVLIALFERTVGLYASLINVNAYHQPGVEAGKKAAEEIISIQQRILSFLAENKSKTFHVEQIASGIGTFSDVESVFRICEHLSANRRGIVRFSAEEPFRSTYQAL